jgi:arylsulfatase A-like enzyme
LCEKGLYFNQVYAGCAVCAPCRSVLMTGYHMGSSVARCRTRGICGESCWLAL